MYSVQDLLTLSNSFQGRILNHGQFTRRGGALNYPNQKGRKHKSSKTAQQAPKPMEDPRTPDPLKDKREAMGRTPGPRLSEQAKAFETFAAEKVDQQRPGR